MNKLQKMKELFESGNYVIVKKKLGVNNYEFGTRIPNGEMFSENEVINILGYKLILKEHERIADAVIANPDVEVLIVKGGLGSFINGRGINEFFERYNEEYSYEITAPSQINSMEDLNELPIVEKELKTISIKDDKGKEYKFEKPEFECELLCVDKLDRVYFVSYNTVYSWRNNIVLLISTEDSYDIGDVNYKINLTLIKPKWYEKKSSFPALIVDKLNKDWSIVVDYNSQSKLLRCDDGGLVSLDDWRLATKEEVMSLYYDNKE